MFGTLRFVLALMVVVTHVGGIEVVAGIAVWGFFMLSGFLMTAVLNTKYGFDAGGMAAFATSRAIRLLPTYWVMLALTAFLIDHFALSVDARRINDALAMPGDMHEALANLFIVGHTIFGIGRIEHALSPSAWAVDVEILMYACSCLFLARSERVARTTLKALVIAFPLLWLAGKFLVRQGQSEIANQLTYSFLPAALLPYAIGSCLWFARERIARRWHSDAAAVLSGVLLVVCALGISRVSVTAAYALSLPFMAILILRLARLKPVGLPARIDDVLGRMSYPIYLVHWICAYLVVVAVSPEAGLYHAAGGRIDFTGSGFVVVLAAVLLVSLVTALAIEAPIERIRHAAAARVVRRRLKVGSVEKDLA